jgi:PIN domain nuclease of toxin-antitoxin system
LVVLDSWALLAYLNDEPPAGRIEEEWVANGAVISSINLGEALYIRIRQRGEDAALTEADSIRRQLTVVDPDWDLVTRAARVKALGGLSYADAFCIATAERLDAPLWTGDPEIIDRAKKLPCKIRDLRA